VACELGVAGVAAEEWGGSGGGGGGGGQRGDEEGGGAAGKGFAPPPQEAGAEECRFFNSHLGCRAGAACRYKHVPRAGRTPANTLCPWEITPAGCNPFLRGLEACPYQHNGGGKGEEQARGGFAHALIVPGEALSAAAAREGGSGAA
jgi:hypothetical protein